MSNRASTDIRNHHPGHLTYANVVATLALVIAVGGGAAYAADTIGSPDVIDESLLSQDIKNGEVKGPDIATNAVGTGKIGNNQVFSEDVRDDSLPGGGLLAADLAVDSVGSSELQNGSVAGLDIEDESVSGSDIGFGAVESADIFDGSINGIDVADQGIGLPDLATDSVSQFQIRTNAVGTSEIANGAVRVDDLSGSSVESRHIVNATIQDLDIADGAVESELDDGGVGSAQFGTITERSVSFGVNEGEFASATANCTADEQVISGGFDLSFPNRIKITDNQRSGNGWFVQAFNDPGAGDLGGTTAFAYCLGL